MAHPALIRIESVTCKATEDTVGRDDLYLVMGPHRVYLGPFHPLETRDFGIEKALGPSITSMKVYEHDLLDADDLMATIDLTSEMDTPRVEHFAYGTAAYMIAFYVASASD